MSRWVEVRTYGIVVRNSDTDELETLESAEAHGFRAPNGEPIKDWLRSLLGPQRGVGVGDVVEIVGLACLVVAFYFVLGLGAAFASLGVALVYEGQCYAPNRFPKPRLPHRRIKSDTQE